MIELKIQRSNDRQFASPAVVLFLVTGDVARESARGRLMKLKSVAA